VFSNQKALESIKDVEGYFQVDDSSTISITEVQPNYLKYQSNNTNDGFAVFSEVYYPKGWKTFIDGEPVNHMRVNYILRGMKIPAGNF